MKKHFTILETNFTLNLYAILKFAKLQTLFSRATFTARAQLFCFDFEAFSAFQAILRIMISVKFALILALLSFIVGKIWFSWYFIRHCIATDEVLFDNQKFLDDFVKKNQTLLHSIEADSHFYLNRLSQRKYPIPYVPHEYEEVFKQEYKKYLNFYEEIVQKYQDVFFYGYFKIINDKDGPEILQLLLDLHKNRTRVLSMSFKDKGPFEVKDEVVAKNKEMQQSIGINDKIFQQTSAGNPGCHSRLTMNIISHSSFHFS